MALWKKIRTVEDPKWTERYHSEDPDVKAFGGRIVITLKDGNVIADELAVANAHTLGATDKYDPASDAPRYPDGYGDPREIPLYPQQSAELMAGRRMLSATRWVQADDLDEVVVGPATALEIRWPLKAD